MLQAFGTGPALARKPCRAPGACKLDGFHWNLLLLTRMLAEWHEVLLQFRPREMPGLSIQLPPSRQFSWLPEELERGIFFMMGTELVLTYPEYAERWWKLMKRHPGYFPHGMPTHIKIRFAQDGAHVELSGPA